MDVHPPQQVRELIESQVTHLLEGKTGAQIKEISRQARLGELPDYKMIHAMVIANGGEITQEELRKCSAEFNNVMSYQAMDKIMDEEEQNVEGNRTEVATQKPSSTAVPHPR